MDIPGLTEAFGSIDLSQYGLAIGGKIGYVIGFVLNWTIIGFVLWKFLFEKYIYYPYEIEITARRGKKEVIKYDRGRVQKHKDGTESFRLRKHKVLLDPLDYRSVLDVKGKPFTYGLVRLFQYSPKSFTYLVEDNKFEFIQLKSEDSRLDEGCSKNLTVIEQDRNRAIEMALKTEKKLQPPTPFTQYLFPLIGMASAVSILVMIWLLWDKGIEWSNVFSAASAELKQAIVAMNKCQVECQISSG